MEKNLKNYLEKFVGLKVEGAPTGNDLRIAVKHRELMLEDKGISVETRTEISAYDLKL